MQKGPKKSVDIVCHDLWWFAVVCGGLRGLGWFTRYHAEGQVDPDDLATKLILDAPEHVESENINLNIGHGSSVFQLFSKRDFYFINCC
jgi:hypothetical protein